MSSSRKYPFAHQRLVVALFRLCLTICGISNSASHHVDELAPRLPNPIDFLPYPFTISVISYSLVSYCRSSISHLNISVKFYRFLSEVNASITECIRYQSALRGFPEFDGVAMMTMNECISYL
jgi:hypothetical protein